MAILIALIPALAWGSIGLVSGKLGGQCAAANPRDDAGCPGIRDWDVDFCSAQH